jgi:hypothetical protein
MSKRLIAAMLTHNEKDRYLEMILENTSKFTDGIVVFDHSTDGSQEIFNKFPNVTVIRPETTWEDGEKKLREELNDYIIKNCNPDWIIGVDADDLYDTNYEEIHNLMESDEYIWYGFQWLDMFNDMNHYKINCSTKAPRLYKVGVVDNYDYGQLKYDVCQVPVNYFAGILPGIYTNIKIKHLGYYTKKDREHHYHNYALREDRTNAINIYGNNYEHILDENPKIYEVAKYVTGGEE